MLPPSALFTVDSCPLHWQKGEFTQIMTVEKLVNTTQRDMSIYPKMSSCVIQVPSRVLALAGQGEEANSNWSPWHTYGVALRRSYSWFVL